MAERSQHRGAPRQLSEVNTEPVEPALARTVWLLNALIRPLTKRHWQDQYKIPKVGGVIFVINHISNADPLAVGQFLAFSGRWPRFLAKSSLFEVPALGWLLRACGQIPVQRRSPAAADALAAAVSAVEAGRAVIVYPEGTITRDPDLWPMAGRTGAARICLQTGCPVIPIGQWGAQEIMYGTKIGFPKLLPRKTLRLKAGDPVVLDDLRGKPVTSAILTEATDRIMDEITALVADLRGGIPPAARYDPRARLDRPPAQEQL
jgi:1-acyl-sn-glycerol-3-phosphate acyltransferase